MTDARARPTLAAIKSALERTGMRPSRRLGQNFLTDPAILARIAGAAGVGPETVVLEVGLGPGTLTAELLARGARVVSVEIDTRMVAIARMLLGSPERLTIVECDVLESRPAPSVKVRAALAAHGVEPGCAPYAFVANLPYQAASPLIVDLLWFFPPSVASVLVQKEVAMRLAAAPASDDYGPLSVLVQLVARVETVLTLRPAAFWPVPAIDSRCVRISPQSSDRVRRIGFAPIRAVVQAAFHARRKRLRNSILSGLESVLPAATVEALIEQKKIDWDRRAETLAPMEFLELAEHFAPALSGAAGASSTSNGDPISD